MPLPIPTRLAANCNTPERREWLHRLPGTLRDLEHRWSLTIHAPFDGPEVSCAWIAPVNVATGDSAGLKLGMPHFEGEHEIEGCASGTATRPSGCSTATLNLVPCSWNVANQERISARCPNPNRTL